MKSPFRTEVVKTTDEEKREAIETKTVYWFWWPVYKWTFKSHWKEEIREELWTQADNKVGFNK